MSKIEEEGIELQRMRAQFLLCSRILSQLNHRRGFRTVPLAYNVIKAETNGSSRPPFVILHGLFGNKSNNRTLGRELNRLLQRDVYLVDLRNHGSSPQDTVHTYEALVQDVARFIHERYELNGKPIILGHSMGAKTAMRLVLEYPELCSMLVSIENAPVTTMPNGKFVQYVDALMTMSQNKAIQTATQADEYLQHIEPNKNTRQFLMTMMQKNGATKRYEPRVPLPTLRKAIVTGAISEWPACNSMWTGPALFIRGTDSGYVADEYLPAIGRYFPRFEVRDVPGAGHWVNSEQPQACAQDIAEFVDRHTES